MMKTAFILVHERAEGGEAFEDLLRARGFKTRNIFTPDHDFSVFDPLAPDLLLVMGGPMGVYEAGLYPFLSKEIAILKARLAADRPTLGICLGAQLMASALGSKVYKGAQGPEFGWHSLKFTGANHPARHLEGLVFQSHGDTFDMPAGARLLASSDAYPHQVFSYGDRALALQCHPEVTLEGLKTWRIPPTNWDLNMDPDAFWRETEINMPGYNARARRFFEEWLESLGL